MPKVLVSLSIAVLLASAPMAARAERPLPLADQAHILHTFLVNQKDKPSPKFNEELVKMVRTFMVTYCAANPCDPGFADPYIGQVVPFDMDSEEGDELLVVYAPMGGVPAGQPDPLIALLDWVDAKWMFVPVEHEAWKKVNARVDTDDGEVVRKTTFWGMRWMEGRPVAVGHRTVSQTGGRQVGLEAEELVLAWFDWQNKPQSAVVPLRYKKEISTACVKTTETLKGYEAFFDVDWDMYEEIVMYDSAVRKETERISRTGVCESVPAKQEPEQQWYGPVIYRMQDGEIRRLEGDPARMLLLRCGAMEWLDAEPWVAVLGLFDTMAEAYAAQEELHVKDIHTLWVFDAAQVLMLAAAPRFLVTTTPYFDKERLQKYCETKKGTLKACVPAVVGKPLPADFQATFPRWKPATNQ